MNPEELPIVGKSSRGLIDCILFLIEDNLGVTADYNRTNYGVISARGGKKMKAKGKGLYLWGAFAVFISLFILPDGFAVAKPTVTIHNYLVFEWIKMVLGELLSSLGVKQNPVCSYIAHQTR